LIKKLLAAGKIKRSDKTVEQLENSRKKLEGEIAKTWKEPVRDPYSLPDKQISWLSIVASSHKECNPDTVDVTSDKTEYDEIKKVLLAIQKKLKKWTAKRRQCTRYNN